MTIPASILRYRPDLHRLRPYPSLADYVAIGICPALIMSMVGSLVLFLLEVSYGGPNAYVLRWTLFWFVLAMVLVSRIAIEKGADYAAFYGLALAIVTSMVIRLYLGSILVVWILLAVIWWCVNKLVWDCTLIDDDEDASGEGLLQRTRREPPPAPQAKEEPLRRALSRPSLKLEKPRLSVSGSGTSPGPAVPPPIPIPSEPRAASQSDPKGQDAWHQRPPFIHQSTHPLIPKPKTPCPRQQRLLARKLQWLYKNRPERDGQPHSPGLWVIYFSVAALPIFGLGQGFLAADNLTGRHFAFVMLWIYVASAFGLLLMTSFLGLRRYLRQRYLRMPVAMTGTWMLMGSGIAVSVLLACLLLPRPNAIWSITAMIGRLGAPPPQPSEHAVAKTGGGQGQGQPGDRFPDFGQSAETAPGKNDGQKQSRTAPTQGDDTPSGTTTPGQSQLSGPSQQTAQHKSTPSVAPKTISPLRSLAVLLKWIFYSLVALVIIILVLRNLGRLLDAAKQLWRDLLDFLSGRAFRRPSAVPLARPGVAPLPPPVRPFASFHNPFLGRGASGRAPADLVLYTFNALQAWAAEHHCERRPEQTPLEFAQALGEFEPALAGEAVSVTHLYTRLAYAELSPPLECLPVLEQLWNKMRSP